MDTDEMFAPLRERPVPPLDVDLDRAVATGRRRVRARRTAAVAGTAALTTAAVAIGVVAARPSAPRNPPSTAAPVAEAPARACRVTSLPGPAGERHVAATAVDPTGRYAVGAVPGSEETGEQGKALLWDNGALRVLTVPGFAPAPLAVSSTGVVVGGVTLDHQVHAWAYVNGTVEMLDEQGGEGSSAVGVNARGDIVGVINRADDRTDAVMWNAARPGTVHTLTARGTAAAANGISDTGVVVGQVAGRPYVWDTAFVEGHPLRVPAGESRGTARSIAGAWVLGSVGPGEGAGRAVLWNLTTGKLQPVTAIRPAAVTPAGVTVGDSAQAAAGPPYRGATMLAGGRVRELPHLPGKRATDEATGVSADGRVVVGRNAAQGGEEAALLWRC